MTISTLGRVGPSPRSRLRAGRNAFKLQQFGLPGKSLSRLRATRAPSEISRLEANDSRFSHSDSSPEGLRVARCCDIYLSSTPGYFRTESPKNFPSTDCFPKAPFSRATRFAPRIHQGRLSRASRRPHEVNLSGDAASLDVGICSVFQVRFAV